MPSRFNIRVYGIWIQDNKLLVNEEAIRNAKVIKLPGGGLELGEGINDCLKREFREELGIDIQVLQHFYTTDFYQPSAFDDTQVISIYYRVTAPTVPTKIINYIPAERTYWMDLKEVTADTFTLPIDKIVGNMLALLYRQQ